MPPFRHFLRRLFLTVTDELFTRRAILHFTRDVGATRRRHATPTLAAFAASARHTFSILTPCRRFIDAIDAVVITLLSLLRHALMSPLIYLRCRVTCVITPALFSSA